MPEFRWLFAADLLSLLGDQVARVALAVLVYQRSGSPLLTALTYVLGYAPWLLGGPLLATLADRLPRRRLMVGCDLARAGLVALMTLPSLPSWALFVLLFAVALLAPPFEAARAALLPEVLVGDVYVVGASMGSLTNEVAQLAGFVGGGALVAVLGTRGALGVDAATFLVSAVLVRVGLHHRCAPTSADVRSSLVTETLAGARLVFGTPALRALVLLACTGAAFGVVPEGLAAPYAESLGGGAATTGLLMAALPAGTVVGTGLLARCVAPSRRMALARPLALGSAATVAATALLPGLGPVLAGLALAGLLFAFQLPVQAAFVTAVPPLLRGRAFGLAQAALQVAQGLALLVAGAAAQVLPISSVVCLSGLVGVALVLRLWAPLERALTPWTEPIPSPRRTVVGT